MNTCAGCGQQWGGYRTAHCSGCHTTYTSLSAFDKHRDGSHTVGRFCRAPGDVGLVDSGRGYECFGFPGDNRWEEAS